MLSIEPQTSKSIQTNQLFEISLVSENLKNIIWFLGIPAWLFGITDRFVAFLASGYFSAASFLHLWIISLFFVGWLYLQPQALRRGSLANLQSYRRDANPRLHERYLCKAERRMLEMRQQHLVSQEYTLPFPYLCQIYHLLNLKHLESVHHFSLNHLKILQVSALKTTHVGGMIEFQTVLESPFNALRIWRQAVVEAKLILHTPYMVELSIPVYGQKTITVMFNVLPLGSAEHKFFIDIYSNLEWPRPLLQLLLHLAACLTLFEDLPYLRRLAERKVERLTNSNRLPNHETMRLYQRFVDLYGPSLRPALAEE